MPVFLDATDAGFEAAFTTLLNAKREDSPDVDAIVAGIIADVRARGRRGGAGADREIRPVELTPDTMRISQRRSRRNAAQSLARGARGAWNWPQSASVLSRRQMPEDQSWTDEAGRPLGWRWTPVSAAGLYVPGGSGSLIRRRF